MSYLPENDKLRKGLPLFRFVTGYFPKAIREMTKVSVVNNVRYNPDRNPADINWSRGKSTDQLGSSFRHMMESEIDGKVFEEVPKEIAELTGIDKIYVLAENAWRACAALEIGVEEQEALDAIASVPLHEPVLTQELTYPCGCSATGPIVGGPLPDYCATHGSLPKDAADSDWTRRGRKFLRGRSKSDSEIRHMVDETGHTWSYWWDTIRKFWVFESVIEGEGVYDYPRGHYPSSACI